MLRDGTEKCTRPNEEKHTKQLHGTTRAIINNMIVGVNEGYTKKLGIEGIGYKAELKGKNLNLSLGFSHQIVVPGEDGIKIEVPDPNTIIVSGIDKQKGIIGEEKKYQCLLQKNQLYLIIINMEDQNIVV